jgi:hypothetical protein
MCNETLVWHIACINGFSTNPTRWPTVSATFFQQEDEMSTKTGHRHHPSQTDTAGAGETPTQKDSPANGNTGPDERFHLTQVRAYELWEQAGGPNDDGSRERFWLDAEKEITASRSVDA